MIIYNFDKNNKYVGESIADKDPLETGKQKRDVFLLPARSTIIKPPKEEEGFNIIWSEERGSWIKEIIIEEKNIEVSLEEVIEVKCNEIRSMRDKLCSYLLLVRNIDKNKSYYLKPTPAMNLFESANCISDNETRKWGVFRLTLEEFEKVNKGNKILNFTDKELVELTKSDLRSLSSHLEARKTNCYNLCDEARKKVSLMKSKDEVNSFDIEKFYGIK